MDKIKIKKLKIFAYHGCNSCEKENGQYFLVSVSLFFDFYEVSKTDDIKKTVSFPDVIAVIKKTMIEDKYNTIEFVAEKIAQNILLSFNIVKKVNVKISKPNIADKLFAKDVCVKISRQWHDVFISYGSNLGDSENIIKNAIKDISENKLIRFVKNSTLLKTKPYGYLDQPDFLNGCCKIKTLFHQNDLLFFLQSLEKKYCRKKTIKNGPRTLDLDIVFYDNIVYEDDVLTIPHLDIENREFVLKPLVEICGNYVHPIFIKTVKKMYEDLLKNN